jgi:hypothetical protein
MSSGLVFLLRMRDMFQERRSLVRRSADFNDFVSFAQAFGYFWEYRFQPGEKDAIGAVSNAKPDDRWRGGIAHALVDNLHLSSERSSHQL